MTTKCRKHDTFISECDIHRAVMSEEDWLKEHEGHKIENDIYEFELDNGRAVKRMHTHKCVPCGQAHLYKMETVKTGGTS